MDEKITVLKALKKSDRMLKYPAQFIVFMFFLFTGFLMVFSRRSPYLFVYFIASYFTGLILSMLYKSLLINKWRVWTFEQVNDIQELKQAIDSDDFLSEGGDLFSSLEYKSDALKQKLKEINERLKEPTTFADDYTLPNEVAIYKDFPILKILGSIALLFGLMFTLWISKTAGWVIMTAGVAAILLPKKLYYLNGNKPPLFIISEEGITTPRTGLIKWAEVYNASVNAIGSGRSRNYVFVFEYPGGKDTTYLFNMGVRRRYLNHVLYVYRQRHLINKPN